MKRLIKNTLPLLLILMLGLSLNSCKKDGEGEDDKTPEHVHNMTVQQVVEATCLSEGYTKYKCTGCDYSYIDDETSILEHVDNDFDFYCDYQCGNIIIDSHIINNIVINTKNLTNVKIEMENFQMASTSIFYVQDDLIYYNSDEQEFYIYNSTKYIFNETWAKNTLEGSVDYTLGYYFNSLNNTLDLSDATNITSITCTYGYFENRNGFEFTNKDNVKFVIFVNPETKTLDGILVKDENNNYIVQYVITKGVVDEYKTNVLDIIDQLNK